MNTRPILLRQRRSTALGLLLLAIFASGLVALLRY